ncbi:hypothetical protein [Burkholderia anthina]|uniref:hypothetical protein n=1 Tax=Burkholderia anthina TaxID=179879 RepID=UPI001AA06F55|nr:hypothetical protein [Burkholderia anthina]QTD91281.1 hypothetical protein J4G50_07885 [Burkholderia anthina]
MDKDQEMATLRASLAKNENALSRLKEEQRAGNSRIRQGVKASVETVPMPVRLTTDQAKALKILAAMEGTTASAIIRGCISTLINEIANGDPAFNAALDAAGVKEV